jgi:hypothetical protein
MMGRSPLRRMISLISATVFALGLLVAGQATANAGSSCSYPFCSETFNASQYRIIAAHDWCGTDEIKHQDTPPCGWSDPTMTVFPGNHTPSTEDWDSFRVDRGYEYIVQVWSEIWGWSSVGSIDNRSAPTASWVRVHNDQTWYVRNQISGFAVAGQLDHGKAQQPAGALPGDQKPVIEGLRFANGQEVIH